MHHWFPPRGDPARALLLGGFSSAVAIGLSSPFVPLYVLARHGSAADVAAFVTIPLVANMAVQLPAGRMLDAFGRRPLLVGSRMVFALACIPLFIARGPLWTLLLVRTAQGVTGGAYQPALRTALVDVTDLAVRGQRFSQLQGMMMAGTLVGPLMGSALASINPAAAFGGAAIPALVATVTFWRVGETGPTNAPYAEDRRAKPRREARTLRSLPGKGWVAPALILGATGGVTGMHQVVWAQYLGDRGWGATVVGMSVSLFCIPAIVMTRRVGMLADRSNRRVLAGSALTAAAGCIAIYPLLRSLPLVLIAGFAESLSLAFLGPVVLASLSQSVPAESRGRAMAVGGFSEVSGVAAGSGVIGALYGINPATPFIAAAAILVIAAVGTAWLQPTRRAGGLAAQRFLEAMSSALEGRTVDVARLRRLGSFAAAPGAANEPSSRAVTLYLEALDAMLDGHLGDPELLEKLGDQREALDLAWRLHYNARWRSETPGITRLSLT